jgi:hypothetical protein
VAAVVLVTQVAALALRWGSARRAARPPGPAWATVPGLARRAQVLADRQLQLLEELARDEPDPDRRHGLAGVGDLGARLRRAAETLLAMTGAGPAGRRAGQLPVATSCAPPSPLATRARAVPSLGRGQGDT